MTEQHSALPSFGCIKMQGQTEILMKLQKAEALLQEFVGELKDRDAE